MADRLPDEILKEILAPHLRVSTENFESMESPSPFFMADQTSSHVLVVNKRWMRVATPLLYEVVVLRSSALQPKPPYQKDDNGNDGDAARDAAYDSSNVRAAVGGLG